MRKRLLSLCFLMPLLGHTATPSKLTYGEYSKAIERLGAVCVAKGVPAFNGLCMSQRYSESISTALTVALATHGFESFLAQCGLSAPQGWAAAKNGAFNIADVKTFYGEMAPQTEALDVYSRYTNECKSGSENEAELTKDVQWFVHMAAKYSDEGRAQAAQAEREQRLRQSLAEKAQWETDPWFVGAFSGGVALDNGALKWSLKCAMGEACDLTVSSPGAPPQTLPMRVPIRREIAIPNNNLRATRETVRERPELYQDAREGSMLEPLRGLLNSDARFHRCVDIGAESDLALCALTTDPRASTSLVLLWGTMKGACGDSPFCAYYYQVLGREKGG